MGMSIGARLLSAIIGVIEIRRSLTLKLLLAKFAPRMFDTLLGLRLALVIVSDKLKLYVMNLIIREAILFPLQEY